MVPLLAAGAALAGLALGFVLLGPAFDHKPGAETGAAAAASGESGKGHGGGKEGEKGSFLEIDNVVVNPSGSEGVHFLMASVTIELADKKAEEALRSQEHVVRDLVVNLLSNHTLEDFSRPGARESIKAEIARSVAPLVEGQGRVDVYLPQFVVQ